LFTEFLPGGIFVAVGDRIRKNREGDRAEAGKTDKISCGAWPLLLVDFLEETDGGEDIAGFRLVTDGENEWRRERGVFKPRVSRVGSRDGR
jgi:hypothetical protein